MNNKNNLALYLVFILHFFIGSSNALAQCEAQFLENNGLLVAEMEEGKIASSWIFRNDISGHTGEGFLEWKGGDNFGSPGSGLIEFKIRINNPGTYQFKWHSKVGSGSKPTEHNDSWLRIPDASDFYGFKSSTNSTVRPKGVCTSGVDCPAGAGADGWFKLFLSGTTNWTWSTLTSDFDGHDIFAKFDTAGVYTIQISGRSNNHMIDRFVLYNTAMVNTGEATSLSNSSSLCPDFDYGLFKINIIVKSSSQTIANAEVKLGDEIKMTNVDGEVDFENLQRKYFDTLRIAADNYEPYLETVNILGSYARTIILTPKRYSIIFTVTDGTNPLEGATVKIGTLSSTTNAQGITSIANILPFDNIQYSVSQEGFVIYNGTVDVVNEDVEVIVSLTPTSARNFPERNTLLYPNPAKDHLFFEFESFNLVDIYTIKGQHISTHQISDGLIDVSDLNSGLYFVSFKNDNESIVIKFIKD